MHPVFGALMSYRANGTSHMPVTITGTDPVLPTSAPLAGTLAQVIAATGVSVADIWTQRGWAEQTVSVDLRHVAAVLNGPDHARLLGQDGVWQPIISSGQALSRALTRPWQTKDGHWLLPHFGLPHLRRGMLELLGCDANPDSVATAVSRWEADSLEQAIAERGLCGAKLRTADTWRAEPQGAALANTPVIEIEKIADSDPVPFDPGPRPLSGISVLDLTRILAGPVSTRCLAEHGADVLTLTTPDLPQISEYVLETGRGKRRADVDLKSPDGQAAFQSLLQRADVFVQSFRPGVMERLDCSATHLSAQRPGLIYASVNCYGHSGPLSARGGWEQVAQAATGLCWTDNTDQPRLLPVAACDFTTGYLTAYGILIALLRRASEGGSYHVCTSLCRTAMMTGAQDRVSGPAPDTSDISGFLIESDTDQGRLRHVGPAVTLSQTPAYWA